VREPEQEEIRDIDPLGAGALFMGCTALLCASIWWLCPFLAPLALGALLAGVIALVRTLRTGRTRLIFPIAGTAVPTAVVFVALVVPSLLGPTYVTYTDNEAMDLAEIRRIPLQGGIPAEAQADGQWANASRTSLQQQHVIVRVSEVMLGRLDQKLGQGKTGKSAAFLVVYLVVRQLADARMPPGQQRSPGTLNSQHPPRLTDAADKEYALVNAQTIEPADSGRGRPAMGDVTTVWMLVFEPGDADQDLRLEVPAAAWDGTGTYRFRIPSTMIRRKSDI
jgi:hypothetical protein